MILSLGRTWREWIRIVRLIQKHSRLVGLQRKLSLVRTMGYLYFRGKFYPDRICRFTLLGFCVSADKPLTAYLLIEELFLRDVYQIPVLSSKPLIVDGGANIGLSILYFKYRYPTSKIVAFEPQVELFSFLEENVKNNKLSDVSLHNCCLSGEEGVVRFYRAPSGLNHSLIPPLQGDQGFDLIESCRLSDHISGQAVDLIKLDIEGAETEVIRELSEKKVLGNSAYYVIEIHGAVADPLAVDQLYRTFQQEGFRSWCIGEGTAEREISEQVWGFERLV